MKNVFIVNILLLIFTNLNAQISIGNPSFEGIHSIDFELPSPWTICDYHVATACPDELSVKLAPFAAYHGSCYGLVQKRNPPANSDGSIVQKLNCNLVKDRVYSISFQAASIFFYDGGQQLFNGSYKFWLGRDSCDRNQLVYSSPILDTVWTEQRLQFTPDSDYTCIIFSAEYDTIKFVEIALDALSPIYLINANAVHVANSDTVIYKRGSEQPCVPLHATSSIATFDTVRWYKLVDDTLKVPVANGFSTTQCLDSSTTFLIGMRDSVMGCAGVEWSWDTVRVWVRDTVLGINEGLQTQDASFQLQPNPVKQVLTIAPLFDGPFNWEISDALGRSILHGNGRDETLVNVEPLQRGAYLMKVEGVVRRFLKE